MIRKKKCGPSEPDSRTAPRETTTTPASVPAPRAGQGEIFTLHLRPVPPGKDHLGRDAAYRLKLGLKYLLRACGLRAATPEATEARSSGESQ